MLTNLKTYQLAFALHKECLKLNLKYYVKDQLLRAFGAFLFKLSKSCR